MTKDQVELYKKYFSPGLLQSTLINELIEKFCKETPIVLIRDYDILGSSFYHIRAVVKSIAEEINKETPCTSEDVFLHWLTNAIYNDRFLPKHRNTFKNFTCENCGGMVCLTGGREQRYREIKVGLKMPIPSNICIPTCGKCKEEYSIPEVMEPLDELLENNYQVAVKALFEMLPSNGDYIAGDYLKDKFSKNYNTGILDYALKDLEKSCKIVIDVENHRYNRVL